MGKRKRIKTPEKLPVYELFVEGDSVVALPIEENGKVGEPDTLYHEAGESLYNDIVKTFDTNAPHQNIQST